MFLLAPEIAPYFKNDDSAFDEILQLQGQRFRNMDGRTTQRIVINDKAYFIKQHRGVGIMEIIKNWMQFKTPVVSAYNEWAALLKLKALGICVPNVLGYGAKGLNPANRQSFIILEAIEPAISLETLTASWKSNKPNFAFKRSLINAVADITATMHQAGINHRDLYICHFLLKQQVPYTPLLPLYLIDLHRAQIRDSVPMRWRIKDLAGLYFSSLQVGLSHRDRLHFMKRYSKLTLRNTLKRDAFMWNNTYLRGERLNRDHQ